MPVFIWSAGHSLTVLAEDYGIPARSVLGSFRLFASNCPAIKAFSARAAPFVPSLLL